MGLGPRFVLEGVPFAALLAGEAGGVWLRGGLLVAGNRAAATGFFVRTGFVGCVGLDCVALESTAFVVDDLDAVFTLTVATGLEGSGFLGAADAAAVVGFLVAVVERGRLTSFLAAAGGGGLGCAAVVLPVDGAALTLETAVLAVGVAESLVVAVGGLEAIDVGREVEGPVAGLVVFDAAAPAALVVVEALVFGAVEGALLVAAAVVLGLAPLTVSVVGFFLGVPFNDDLVPFVTVPAATEVVLVGPADFLSGTLV